MGEIRDRIEECYHEQAYASNERSRIATAISAFSHKMQSCMRANIGIKEGWNDLHHFPERELKKNLLVAVVEEDWVSVGCYAMIANERK
ncbi:hypothetical protein [Pseudovibrio sp. Tun.PSC04-5.I4]|uniref:hypothetical protein n=1 Tax=Pseudovibrio sp. Tun.PSC04-5.I4 TaxID=1798213 RepID=UPI000B81E29A|nr:hypothetical protein [Pseudovibrio sp. Tun.PSC04-5.I4]